MSYDYNKGSEFIAYDTANGHVRKTKQVVMLFDAIVSFVQRSKEYRDQKDFQEHFNVIDRASKIVLGLQASLDHENGGEVSTTLDAYYTQIFLRLHQLTTSEDMSAYDQLATDIRKMRDAWEEIDSQQKTVDEEAPEVRVSDEVMEQVAEGAAASGISVSV